MSLDQRTRVNDHETATHTAGNNTNSSNLIDTTGGGTYSYSNPLHVNISNISKHNNSSDQENSLATLNQNNSMRSFSHTDNPSHKSYLSSFENQSFSSAKGGSGARGASPNSRIINPKSHLQQQHERELSLLTTAPPTASIGAIQTLAGIPGALYMRPEENDVLSQGLEASISSLHEKIITRDPSMLPLFRKLTADIHMERTRSIEHRSRLLDLVYSGGENGKGSARDTSRNSNGSRYQSPSSVDGSTKIGRSTGRDGGKAGNDLSSSRAFTSMASAQKQVYQSQSQRQVHKHINLPQSTNDMKNANQLSFSNVSQWHNGNKDKQKTKRVHF